jgi:DNA-directed RNA polymerase alpha subunit
MVTLTVKSKDGWDPCFVNLLRRIILRDIRFHAFFDFKVEEYIGKLPLGQIIHRIAMLTVKGKGAHRIDITGPSKVFSEQITGPGTVDNGVLITELGEEEKLNMTFISRETDGKESPETVPFCLTTTKNGQFEVESMSELYGKDDCKAVLKTCGDIVSGYVGSLNL